MSIDTVSEEGHEGYEIWTCDTCGHSIILTGVGGDVCGCLNCLKKEHENESRNH